RPRLGRRAAVLGGGREELLAGLDALASSRPHPALLTGRATGRAKVAFMLSGQGSQRPGMGAGLRGAFPVYAEALADVCAELDPHLGLSLEEHLTAAEGTAEAARLDRTELTQPALFATAVALHRLLGTWGLHPDLLIGHSVGELAAAHLAGVLSLPDASTLVAARGRLMGELPEGGAMVAIEAAEEELGELAEGLSLAAVNAPGSVVVSGSEEAVTALAADWKARERRTSRLRVSHAFHSALIEPMLEEFAEVAAALSYAAPQIPIVSGPTGAPLGAEEACSPAYWVRQARLPVRFADGIAQLRSVGVGAFLELGPGGALCAMAQAGLPPELAPVALLREGHPEPEALLRGVATAHAGGVGLEWGSVLGTPAADPADLPTYPFRRTRYWLAPGGGRGDASALGQAPTGHPLLGATTTLAGSGETLLGGRVAASSLGWPADHVVHGTAILPGTAFLELALRAAEEVGLGRVEELTLAAPLPLPDPGGVALQVRVGPIGEEDRRGIEIYSRPEGRADDEGEWTLHASGSLGPAATARPDFLDQWPPSGAEPEDVADFYERAAERGVEYGPAFQGVRAVWRRGEELFAEIEPDEAADPAGYAIHPSLLDAAIQPGALVASDDDLRVPFSWTGVEAHTVGATALRVRMRIGDDSLSLDLADGTGAPTLTIGSLALRELGPAQLRGAAAQAESLFTLGWTELDQPAGAPAEDRELPETVELLADPGLDPATAAGELCGRGLEALQGAIAAGTRLAVVTRGAQALGGGEVPDAAGAALWGLVRSAQAEHPGLFALIDLEAGAELPPDALALTATEHQLAVRDGALLAPRLAPAEERSEDAGDPAPSLDPERTVLVTGATGGLGPLLARHLVEKHGARHLLLVSRGGPEAEGAAELRSGLEELGAQVEIGACDVGERDQVAELIASIDPDHPLGAVFHCAGTLDDGLVDALDAARLHSVFTAKAGGAWHLHELTAGADLTHFVLFSSIAGTFNNPGQGNYAAANAFLDALARQRNAAGLPAVSLGWGGWEREGGMLASLGDAGRSRLRRGGMLPLEEAEGLELLDRALALASPHLLPVALDRGALRAAARAGSLPPLFRGLIKAPIRAAARGSLAERLAGVAEAERQGLVLALVRSHVAAVLGHDSAEAVDPDRAFTDLGFDSLAAVELRNRLAAATGLQLQATLVFDHPNAAAVAEFLLAQVEGGGSAAGPVVVRTRDDEPIAIVGMSCRYPGGISTPDQLWELVATGGDAISSFPTDRGWDLERLYDPDPDHPGTTYAREGGFLRSAGDFDAEFFGISPREALATDPQQRLLLEGAWEALEAAGIDPASLRGTETGVFAGVMYHDYARGAAPLDGGHRVPEAAGSIVSGRVAYTLGLEGPAVSVDTACSSSLVAIHLAAQALRAGECPLALVGGVAVMATPSTFVEFSRQRGLAPDGRCKSFSAAADGTAWAEGAGLLVLERLSVAEREGHRVLATIRGSAVNQDGASNGLTAPNGPSQERVIRRALADAGLEPGDVDAVEAHGTGTTLGDPIEATALLNTYGRDRDRPLHLGSLKSNLGHSQAAAGVGGVIKTVMAMRHATLPRTLHVEEPSPHVDWDSGAVELLREERPWEREEGRPRRAGVSSFGVSGTNAHLIVEEAPPAPEAEEEAPSPPALPAVPLLLSAAGEDALAAQGARLAETLRAREDLGPAEVAVTLALARPRLGRRAAVLGGGREELLAGLDALASSRPHPALLTGRATGRAKVAF
ncbi:MAG TPA: SDR family NAD(P)-dependent oxidoreductase, partial [Solirubrobacterales bacterium]|nr:SDR family NAD(P)-dependent oxidoreductase [Solirubrobacterales bacterium]